MLTQPAYLRIESRKSWQYFPSDQLVYIKEFRDDQRDSVCFASKDYLNADRWIEAHYVVVTGSDKPKYCVAIISSDGNGRTANLRPHCGGVNGNPSVFVDISERSKPPKEMGAGWDSVPSVVWLKCFDDADGFIRYADSLTLEKSDAGLVSGFNNRELNSTGRSSVKIGNTPDCMIQCGPKTMQKIAQDEENPDVRLLNGDFKDIATSHRFFFDIDFVWAGIAGHVIPQCRIQLVKMCLRPFGFKVGVG